MSENPPLIAWRFTSFLPPPRPPQWSQSMGCCNQQSDRINNSCSLVGANWQVCARSFGHSYWLCRVFGNLSIRRKLHIRHEIRPTASEGATNLRVWKDREQREVGKSATNWWVSRGGNLWSHLRRPDLPNDDQSPSVAPTLSQLVRGWGRSYPSVVWQVPNNRHRSSWVWGQDDYKSSVIKNHQTSDNLLRIGLLHWPLLNYQKLVVEIVVQRREFAFEVRER